MIRTEAANAARRVWGATPAGTAHAGGAAPGTQEFFERVVYERSTVELPWLSRVVPFHRFDGQHVLEIGCGAGYDAYEIVKNGARYVGVDITPQNIDRTSMHLSLMGLEAEQLLVADAIALPFAEAKFDSVFSNGVLHHVDDIDASLREAYRVLRPGGELWTILYHRQSAFYLVTQYLYHWWLRGKRKSYASFAEFMSTIEYSSSDARALVRAYTAEEVDRMLASAGFSPRRSCIRKLIAEDLPSPPMLHGLPWRLVPQSVLDVFATRFGWYVVSHARKP